MGFYENYNQVMGFAKEKSYYSKKYQEKKRIYNSLQLN